MKNDQKTNHFLHAGKRALFIAAIVLILVVMAALDGRLWEPSTKVEAAALTRLASSAKTTKMKNAYAEKKNREFPDSLLPTDIENMIQMAEARHNGPIEEQSPHFEMNGDLLARLESAGLARVGLNSWDFRSALYPPTSAMPMMGPIRTVAGLPQGMTGPGNGPAGSPMSAPPCIGCAGTPLTGGFGGATANAMPVPETVSVPDIGDEAIFMGLLLVIGVAYWRRRGFGLNIA